MKGSPEICVLGGCGAMGSVVVECLLQQNREIRVTIADRRPPLKAFSKRVRFQKVNLNHHAKLVQVLKRHRLVINSTSHHFNLPVMRAALKAGTHYLDLGGLFHFTRRQLKMDSAFRKKGLIAILGMGCAPGIANILAKWGTEGMDRVDEIHIKVGGRSWDPPSSQIPYAIGTIREELTLKPAVYKNHRWHFESPRSGVEQFVFGTPVGKQQIFRTIHSEVATLPMSFPEIHACSFKIGFPDEIIRAVLKPNRVTSISKDKLPPPSQKPRDCEITSAVVIGRVHGKRKICVASCKVFSKGVHCAGDWDTARPPAVVAQMLVSGEIKKSGVFPPETIVPMEQFFQRLEKNGFEFSKSIRKSL